ncbi:hypothetical protein HJC23_013281 [Cyclotella cryptica]|uniref:STI1/HOP DP domain-containing protein n=1 Tax=Cyclotella cryptica TaxID=29204 RepID=A0ABD3PA86_9STRA|eukprot:CCRYP_016923-RA/>CCRYP_016923-RA protein AED:0.22 eAED:0.22 QI:0/-1/0/1/-1/1/1/0/210
MPVLHPRTFFLASSFITMPNHGAIGFVRSLHRHKWLTPSPTHPLPITIEIEPADDDVSLPQAGKMKLSEIKSELDLRGVSYKDCFDRESLEGRLHEARCSGKADPRIIDQFNERNAKTSETFLDVDEKTLENSLGGDGTLPGGMPPEMLQKMMSDPELVTMLRSSKMQEVMKLVMEGGKEAFDEAMTGDKEMFECVQKLNTIMGKLNEKP